MMDIFEDAKGRWLSLLPMFGVASSFLTGRSCPCPTCGGKDRFRFTDFKGKGDWICNQCGAGNGMTLIMAMTGKPFREIVGEVRDKCGSATTAKPKATMSADKARSLCVSLWKESKPIGGDDAGRYLWGRALSPPFGNQLRYHPDTPVKGHPTKRALPAMLARVSNHKGEGINIHRTYLDNGAKAQWDEDGVPASVKRLMPGALPSDAAIRLFGHEGELAVAEGIETALAIHRDYAIPCWSLISSGHMSRWDIPEGVKVLHIFGDADANYTGQAAAYTLANRMAVKHRDVKIFVRVPDTMGEDFAD